MYTLYILFAPLFYGAIYVVPIAGALFALLYFMLKKFGEDSAEKRFPWRKVLVITIIILIPVCWYVGAMTGVIYFWGG